MLDIEGTPFAFDSKLGEKMKRMTSMLIVALGFAALAHAGQGPIIQDLLVSDLGEGNTRVEGNLAEIRFTTDDTQQLGCRVRGADGAASVLCAGTDINNTNYLCFSFDPALVAAAQSISPYSYVRFEYGTDSVCTSILVATRSFHIPDSGTEKAKKK